MVFLWKHLTLTPPKANNPQGIRKRLLYQGRVSLVQRKKKLCYPKNRIIRFCMRYPYSCRAVQSMSAVFFVSAWTLIVVDLRPHYTPFQVFVHFRILIISQAAVVMCTLCTSRLTFRPRVLLLTNVQFGRTNSPFWLGLLRSCTRFNP